MKSKTDGKWVLTNPRFTDFGSLGDYEATAFLQNSVTIVNSDELFVKKRKV